MQSGEEHAWDLLGRLPQQDVCRRALASYDHLKNRFSLPLLSQDIIVDTKSRQLAGASAEADALLERVADYATLSVLWYLIGARPVPLTGRLVKPGDMGSGEFFDRGTHVLPLQRIARRYGDNIEGFLAAGRCLGGEPQEYADASLRLPVFPRVPVVLLLWARDPEFAARANLLFDSSVRFHMPVDVIWSTAMMALLAML